MNLMLGALRPSDRGRPDKDDFSAVWLSKKPGAKDRLALWISHNTGYEPPFLVYITLHHNIAINIYLLSLPSKLY